MSLRASLTLGLAVAAATAALALWWKGEPDTNAATPALGPAQTIASEQVALHETNQPEPEVQATSVGTRRTVDAPQQPAAAPPNQQEAREGILLVVVRSKDTGLPIPGTRLLLIPSDRAEWSATHVEGFIGRPGESPVTDEEGRAQFYVPLGERFTLQAQPGQGSLDQLEVPVFDSPGSAEVVLELSTTPDLPFVGRVVTADAESPVADAEVIWTDRRSWRTADGKSARRKNERVEELVVDSDGYFEATFRSWDNSHLEITAPGFGLVFGKATRGHETRATALEIRLSPSASVGARVLGRTGEPLEGMRVQLTTESYRLMALSDLTAGLGHLGDIDWSCATEADGRCAIEGLPANIPLAVSYHTGTFTRSDPTPLVLLPGEHRELLFRAGVGATITGQLVGRDRAGEADVDIWMKPAERDLSHYFQSYESDDATITTTDPHGRFSFEDVADGMWLIGPSPESLYPPKAEVVHVVEGIPDRQLRLEAVRLFIKGHVLDSSGSPLEGMFVSARQEDGLGSVNASTDGSGAFSIGPLAPGAFVVSCESFNTGYADSEPIRAEAGEEEVSIQLRRGGSIRGTLVDADTGELLAGEVLVSMSGNTEPWPAWMTWTDREGIFDFQGLKSGTYDVAASTESQKFAIRKEVYVAAGTEPEVIVLEAQPGAVLRMRYVGDQPYGHFQIKQDGTKVAGDGVERGTTHTEIVPVGPILVECYWGGMEAPEVHEITLAAGEDKELVFGEGD